MIGVETFETRSVFRTSAAHVRQIKIEQNDVVVVQLSEVDTLFAQVGRVNVKTFRLRISSMLCAVSKGRLQLIEPA